MSTTDTASVDEALAAVRAARTRGDRDAATRLVHELLAYPGEALFSRWAQVLGELATVASGEVAELAHAAATLEHKALLPWRRKAHRAAAVRAVRKLGPALLAAGHPAQAATILARACEVAPGEPTLIMAYAETLAGLGLGDAAIMSLRTTPKGYLDDHVEARLRLGELLLDGGDQDGARSVAATLDERGVMESRTPAEEAERARRTQAIRARLEPG